MSLSPSRSPSPAGSPATTLPLLPPSLPPLNDHASPPPSFTPLAAPAPISLPPFPPTPLPPLAQISSPLPIVTSPPSPPIVTSAPLPPVSSPPLPISVVALPPPQVIVSPSPPLKPPPGPPPPRLLTPAQRQTTPLISPSTSSPPSPSTVSPLLPATSLAPPASPSPLKAYPPPLATPPTTLPLPLVTPPTILPPPSGPSYSSPSSSALASPSPLPSSLITLPKTPPFSATPPLQLPLANGALNKTGRSSHVSTRLIIGCILGGVILLLVLGLLCFCYKDRKRRKRAPLEYYCEPPCLAPKDRVGVVLSQPSQENVNAPGAHVVTVIPKHLGPLRSISSYGSYGSTGLGSVNSILPQVTGTLLGFTSGTFTYDELVVATNGFSKANLLGEGGFGYVHKGVLQNGKKVAVKRLKTGSHQGEQEFQAEVETISRIHHKHLVSLVGYCITGAERLLVYEFVPNNTLEFHLHGEGQPVMEWETRVKIAIGSAKGLAYLHQDCSPTIIHRDIKASNILLDSNFEAKVSDFGLAKILSDNNTHVSTRVVGTFGYLAPEYASSGKLTDKSDVYSYGIMLLELISGRPPIRTISSFRNESLVEWARTLLNKALEDGNFDALVDPKLENNYNCNEMASMVACAAACVHHSAWLRPRMSQVIRALEGDVSFTKLDESISLGCSTMYSSSGSSNYDSQQYKNKESLNMSLSGKLYGISWHSDSTSEYGLNPSSSSGKTSKQTEM